MEILDTKPHTLKDRQAPDSVAIECHACKTHFLWERRLGPDVKCPCCKLIETMEITNAAVQAPDQRVDADNAVAVSGSQG